MAKDNKPPEMFTVTYCDKCGRSDLMQPLRPRHFARGSLCVGGALKEITYRRDDSTLCEVDSRDS